MNFIRENIKAIVFLGFAGSMVYVGLEIAYSAMAAIGGTF